MNLKKYLPLIKKIYGFLFSPIMFIVVGTSVLVSGFNFFFTGDHNSDLAYNMLWFEKLALENGLNIEITDMGSNFSLKTREEMWILGNNTERWGVILATVGSFMLGSGINEVVEKLKKGK